MADLHREHVVDAADDQPVIRRRQLDDSEMDITPMIDITFLLLIFFLVARMAAASLAARGQT